MTRTKGTGDLLTSYGDGRLTRRQFVQGALALGVSASATAGLLTACHAKTQRAAPVQFKGRVQILIGFDGGNTAAERQLQQTLAQAFIAAHPQVGIDFLRATSAAAAETQLKALVARGSAPDIVLGVGLDSLSRLVDQHLWLDLHPLFSRDGLSTGAFVSPAISAATEPNYFGGTKAIAGLPIGTHSHALAYNMGLFSKAALPAPPASWTDSTWTYSGSFLQAAQTLTVDSAGKHAGQSGFDAAKIVQFGMARLAPETVYFSFGGRIYDASKRRAQFDTPAAIQGAQFAGDLASRYHVMPTASEVAKLSSNPPAGTEDQAAWRAGKLAMIDMCSCEINSPFGLQVPFAWKAAALPAGPARRVGPLEISLGAIVAPSTQHDLAWEVLKFFAVDPAHERDLAVTGFNAVPALNTNVDAFTQGAKNIGVDPAVWAAGRGDASSENDAWVPAFADVHILMTAALAQVSGGAAAATVMPQLQQQAQAKIDSWLKTNKLPH